VAETKITYDTDASLAVTAWTTSLTTLLTATSAIFDNTTSLYMDVLVGGDVAASATTLAAGESFDIYISGQYSETATDMTGALDALYGAAGQEVVDVSFVRANLILLVSIQLEVAAPDTTQDYHWGPIGIAQFFGGVMPKRFMLALHNNTGSALGSGSTVNTTGITYTSA